MTAVETINQLSKSVELLKKELNTLKALNMCMDNFPVVVHNGVNTLRIYGGAQFKAYIPKKFNGWPVEYYCSNKNQIAKAIQDFALSSGTQSWYDSESITLDASSGVIGWTVYQNGIPLP